MRGLRERGEKPALVARGYGEDEILLHRRWNPGFPVIAEEDRAYGAWKAARKGATVVVLDDGFQHRRLARELDIVLVAASSPGKIRLLPRGPFREPLRSLGRAGVVVLTQKGREESTLAMEGRIDPYLREAPVRVAFVPSGWTDLRGQPAREPDGDFLAVAAIGDPSGFSRVLRETVGPGGELLSYPDHHAYGWGDVQTILDRARGRAIVTTEKDAVKLEAFKAHLKDLRVLCLGVEVLEGAERLWHHVESILRVGGRERGGRRG
jgi:tetraacyldisaccharide 4'-kinase